MDQHVEAVAVRREPGHHRREFRRREDDLQVCDGVRADRLVEKTAEFDGELVGDYLGQLLGGRTAVAIVIGGISPNRRKFRQPSMSSVRQSSSSRMVMFSRTKNF